MKTALMTLIIIALLAGSFPCNENEGVRYSRPLPTGEQLNSVCSPCEGAAYSCGNLGVLLRNTGGGWEMLNSPATEDLNSIAFRDKLNGAAVGKKGTAIATSDGGQTWTVSKTGVSAELHALCFTNGSEVLAAGNNGTLLRSTDGGLRWKRMQANLSGPLFCMSFSGRNAGAIGSYNSVFITGDGGLSWHKKELGFIPPAKVESIHMPDSNKIYAAMSTPQGRFLSSSDGGATWTAISLGLPYLFDGAVDLTKTMSFLDQDNGFIATSYGTILRTSNGGMHWLRDTSFRSATEKFNVMRGSLFTSTQALICGGGGTIFRSENAGITFATESGNLPDIRTIRFPSAGAGFAAGEGGFVFRTTDGGISWNKAGFVSAGGVNSLYFTDATAGFACGKDQIHTTVNGGLNWTAIAGSPGSMNSMAGTGSVLIAGGGSQSTGRSFIYKSADSGQTWSLCYDSSEGMITGMSASAGFAAVTTLGNLIRSYDSGNTWQKIHIADEPLSSIQFRDSLTGFAGSVDGVIYVTSDGGNNWEAKFTGVAEDVNSVGYFNGSLFGVCDGGNVTVSKDDGNSWRRLHRVSGNSMQTCDALPDGEVVCAGAYGTVVFYSVSGNTAEESDDSGSFELSIAPNPVRAGKKIRLATSELFLSEVAIELFDITGRLLLRSGPQTASDVEAGFDTGSLPSGIYFLRMTNGIKSGCAKLFVIR